MQTRFPPDTKLAIPPLGEAWLELRWHLKEVGPPGFLQDPDYPFALGAFFGAVRDRYPHKTDLEASRAPLELLPHIVRHQFWSAEGKWPVLQLGPGVASVNFTQPYSWGTFKTEALYLRSALLEAYSGILPQLDVATLRYLNAEPFNFTEKDVLEFLRSNLNTTLILPKGLPGHFASKATPASLNLRTTFDLTIPKGTGALTLATGTRSLTPTSAVVEDLTNVTIWQLEVASGGADAPHIASDLDFSLWLDQAHSDIHEWFFSFIEGVLYNKYSGQGD